MSKKTTPSTMRLAVLCVLTSAMFPSISRAQVPVFKITTEDSSIKFAVKASVAVKGTFHKWDATLIYSSPDQPLAFWTSRFRPIASILVAE